MPLTRVGTDRKQACDHHVIDHFRKSAIIFQRGLAQGDYDAKNRFAISLTSAEKSLPQSALVKKTRPYP